MTEFNYLIHGSLLFAAGLATGLIGALLVTWRGRARDQETRREKTEQSTLRSDTRSDDAEPRFESEKPTPMPIPSLRPAAAGTAAAVSAAEAAESAHVEQPAQTTTPNLHVRERPAPYDAHPDEFAEPTVRTEPVLSTEGSLDVAPEASRPTRTIPTPDDPEYEDPETVAKTLRQALISGGKPQAGGDKSS